MSSTCPSLRISFDSRPSTFRTLRAGLVLLVLLVPAALIPSALAQQEPRALSEGEMLINRQQWDAAEKHYYELSREEPDNADYLSKLGFVELRRPGGDEVRALRYLEKAISIAPGDPITLFVLGRAYDVVDDEKKARATYDKLIELGPGRDDPTRAGAVHLARFARALIALQEKDYDLARELLFEVIRREPNHGYVLYERGFIELESGNMEGAIENFRECLEAVDKWAPSETWPYPQGRYAYLRENVRFELGKALVAAGKASEAVNVLEPLMQTVRLRDSARRRPIKPPPRSPLQGETDARFENAPYYYGEALAAAGRTKEAKDVFKEFSRMKVGDKDLRRQAKDRRKEI